MTVSWPKIAATQFTAYMAILNLSTTTGLKLSGYLSENYSIPVIFMIVAVIQLLVIFIFPFIDVHSHHWDMPVKDLSDLASEMDSLNMAYLINLSGSGFAVFSRNKSLMDLNLKKSIENVNSNFPKRFGVFVNIDLSRIDHPEFKSTTLKTLENAKEYGAIGLKIYKNLGLNVYDGDENRIKVNDERLNFIWQKCAEFNFPVLIHSGEPKPFFDPINKYNERWLHARQKPNSFRPSEKYPSFNEVMTEQYEMFKNNPKTIKRNPETFKNNSPMGDPPPILQCLKVLGLFLIGLLLIVCGLFWDICIYYGYLRFS